MVRARQERDPRPQVRRPVLAHVVEQSGVEQHERHRTSSRTIRTAPFNPGRPAQLSATPHDPRARAPLTYELVMHVYEIFAQDKWQLKPGMTLSMGLRYDLEIMPLEEDPGNPLFTDPSKYPVDKDNISPRLGFVWNPDGEGPCRLPRRLWDLLRQDPARHRSTTSSPTPSTPRRSRPTFRRSARTWVRRNGQFPTEPVLMTNRVDQLTPAVRAQINAAYPPGTQRAKHRHGHLGRPGTRAAVLPSDQRRLRTRSRSRAWRCRSTTCGCWDATCS